MKCPVCGRTDLVRPPGGEHRYGCPACGWGMGDGKQPARKKKSIGGWSGVSPAGGWTLVGLWVASLAMVILPWVFANYLLAPAFAKSSLAKFDHYYWPAVGVYLLASWILNLNFGGSGKFNWLCDDPTTGEDNVNRGIFEALIVMIPGKIVVFALYSTWKQFTSSEDDD